jgi:hypothetical protein
VNDGDFNLKWTNYVFEFFSPMSLLTDAVEMICGLKSYGVLKGVRGEVRATSTLWSRFFCDFHSCPSIWEMR